MTNNLQDRFRDELLRLASLVGTDAKNPEEKLLSFVLSEVEQAKREAYEEGKAYKFNLNKKSYRLDLITELLSEAPDDISIMSYLFVPFNLSREEKQGFTEGFNESNNQWRTLLESKLK